MKEKIYTIPVTDAFRTDCECPLCILEKKLEDSYIEYSLGASLMEPDGRMETNEKGFCRRHFEQLYNCHQNMHGLGLILDTYLHDKNASLKKIYDSSKSEILKDSQLALIEILSEKLSLKQTKTKVLVDKLIDKLLSQEKKCTICSKIDNTMDRYLDVIFYLWKNEEEFRNLFNSKKGFCLKHFRILLEGSKKYLNSRDTASLLISLLDMQHENMTRIQEEVYWFTKKFDYRNNDAPWGNSKDAVPRSIKKIIGHCDLK
jgi:hypothetical protein